MLDLHLCDEWDTSYKAGSQSAALSKLSRTRREKRSAEADQGDKRCALVGATGSGVARRTRAAHKGIALQSRPALAGSGKRASRRRCEEARAGRRAGERRMAPRAVQVEAGVHTAAAPPFVPLHPTAVGQEPSGDLEAAELMRKLTRRGRRWQRWADWKADRASAEMRSDGKREQAVPSEQSRARLLKREVMRANDVPLSRSQLGLVGDVRTR